MKLIKDKWLGARVDSNTDLRVSTYIEASDNLTMGGLVRRAVNEYMESHPIKLLKDEPTKVTKPGE